MKDLMGVKMKDLLWLLKNLIITTGNTYKFFSRKIF